MFPADLEFEWDPAKAAANLKKHGVSFDEATTCFDDHHAVIQADELHSDFESREVLLGYSDRNRLLVVSFIQRVLKRIRLISARKATRTEHTIYED
ncbi:MAG: BrnT family toxin [Chloroflexi bacterium]|nr:BrnT family toxin [Chloroflexota bacterium]